jgi:hypothetical protein
VPSTTRNAAAATTTTTTTTHGFFSTLSYVPPKGPLMDAAVHPAPATIVADPANVAPSSSSTYRTTRDPPPNHHHPATSHSPSSSSSSSSSSSHRLHLESTRGSDFLLLAAEAYEAAERTQRRADAMRRVAMDLARAAARATAAVVVDPASHGTMTASGMGGGRTATDILLPRGTIRPPTEEDRVDAHDDGDDEAARMRRRMRDDDDALRSSASAMLRVLRMQEERDGDDDYHHDRRCAPDDASHSSPPSSSSLAPHPHRECTVVGVADGGAEFGPVRDRASMTVASVRGQTQEQEHRQEERQPPPQQQHQQHHHRRQHQQGQHLHQHLQQQADGRASVSEAAHAGGGEVRSSSLLTCSSKQVRKSSSYHLPETRMPSRDGGPASGPDAQPSSSIVGSSESPRGGSNDDDVSPMTADDERVVWPDTTSSVGPPPAKRESTSTSPRKSTNLPQPPRHQAYRDYSEVPDSGQFVRKKTGGVTVPFPEKLMNMLDVESSSNPDVVSWSNHGRAFVVHRPRAFASEVMPGYFRQSKLTSFQRQLNLYGFRRITQGRDSGAYYHELFLRGRPHLCAMMQRQKVKGTGHKQPTDVASEPNFHAMSVVADVVVVGGRMSHYPPSPPPHPDDSEESPGSSMSESMGSPGRRAAARTLRRLSELTTMPPLPPCPSPIALCELEMLAREGVRGAHGSLSPPPPPPPPQASFPKETAAAAAAMTALWNSFSDQGSAGSS